jgi:hypothetical protein
MSNTVSTFNVPNVSSATGTSQLRLAINQLNSAVTSLGTSSSPINEPAFTASTASTATAGTATALPATPAGYLPVTVNGTTYKIPYYAQ